MSFATMQPSSNQLETNLADLELYESFDTEKNDNRNIDSPFDSTTTPGNNKNNINGNNIGKFLYDEKKSEDDENFFEDMLESILNNQSDRSNMLSKSQESLNNENANKYQTQVVQVNEDDIIDDRLVIKKYFQTNLIEKFECRCDSSLGMFTPKCTKLSKSLQRKLANFHQLLDQYQMNQPNFDNPEGNYLQMTHRLITNYLMYFIISW